MPENSDLKASASTKPADRLDVRGLPCPIPVLKAQKALAILPPKSVLEVLTSDPASTADMTALCLAMGHELILSETLEPGRPELRFLIRRAG